MAPLSYSPTKESMGDAILGRETLEKLALPDEATIRTYLGTGTPEDTKGQPGTVTHGHR